jgi:hypothetical protein
LRTGTSLVDSSRAAVVPTGGGIRVPAGASLLVKVADGPWARP